MFSQLKVWHVLVLPSAVGVIFLLSRGLTPASPVAQQQQPLANMTPFVGGTFEASGVAPVAGADGILFVDNGRKGQVFWMGLGRDGRQAGEIKTFDLGVGIEDVEGLTTDGTYFYAVSSQSRPKAIAGVGLVRFKFDARAPGVSAVESVSGLKKFLVENVAELRGRGGRTGKDGGLNIEGLAWDPRRGRLLLGLRSPLVGGQALLVPLRLRDPRGAFALGNLEVEGSKAIHLSLGGSGVRGVEYDARASAFKILSGATEEQARTDFRLWEWDGDERRPALRETNRFDERLKPEGVARASAGGRDFTIVVFDASGYTVMD